MKYYSRLYSFLRAGSIWGALLASFLILCAAPLARAHETSASWEAEEGNYLLDIGYTGELSAGSPVVFDFNLLKGDSKKDVPFESVWVRLGSERGVYLSTRLHGSETDRTILNYRFLESGSYTLLTRFVGRGGGVLVEHTFPFTVESETSQPSPINKNMLLSVAAALLLGGLVSYLLARFFFLHS